MQTFFLGTSSPHLLDKELSPLGALEAKFSIAEPIPLCVARHRLADRKTLPRARGPWLLDSGGFGALSKDPEDGGYATWPISPHEYIRQVLRFSDQMGHMVAAASMDWMCEPPMVARTGLSVMEHLRRSVCSFLELKWLNADLPIFPVLQGDATLGPDDHLRCADMYEAAGIDLAKEPLVGVGSVCRLGRTQQIVDLFAAMEKRFAGAVKLHGFGVKAPALAKTAPGVWSADSQAGSRRGRSSPPCVHGLGHVSEANCPEFMLEWYVKVLAAANTVTPQQWARTVEAYDHRGDQETVFHRLPHPTPGMPTPGGRWARVARAFLPDGAEEPLAEQIDDFLPCTSR